MYGYRYVHGYGYICMCTSTYGLVQDNSLNKENSDQLRKAD